MGTYRKKPVVVEARKFETNNEPDSINMNGLVLWMNQGSPVIRAWHNGTDIYIETLEGQMKATVGDWVVRGVSGEFYPVKPDIFAATYEPTEPQEAGR
jgi:hypothetical protein